MNVAHLKMWKINEMISDMASGSTFLVTKNIEITGFKMSKSFILLDFDEEEKYGQFTKITFRRHLQNVRTTIKSWAPSLNISNMHLNGLGGHAIMGPAIYNNV